MSRDTLARIRGLTVFAQCVAGGLACRDQRRRTGSGSTLQVLRDDALYKYIYFTLDFGLIFECVFLLLLSRASLCYDSFFGVLCVFSQLLWVRDMGHQSHKVPALVFFLTRGHYARS